MKNAYNFIHAFVFGLFSIQVYCKCGEIFISSGIRADRKTIFPTTSMIFVTAHIAYENISFIKLHFYQDLVQHVDFDIHLMHQENNLPNQWKENRYKNKNISLIGLELINYKKGWAYGRNTLSLYLVKAYNCDTEKDYKSLQFVPIKSGEDVQMLTPLGRFVNQSQQCPQFQFPNTQDDFSNFLTNKLTTCVDVHFLSPDQLAFINYHPLEFLRPNKPIFIINATTSINLAVAAAQVDDFLGKYSVLHLAWEPYELSDLMYFVLVPLPRGIPGHLAAIVDYIQFNHPVVRKKSYLKMKTYSSFYSRNENKIA